MAIFGDGATEQGVFHESLNLASLHQVPIVFLCENNGLAVHSKITARHSYSLSRLSETYGIPTTICEEGYDFLKVFEVFSAAVDAARRTCSPQFVCMNTFRYKEHVGPGDDFTAGYRCRKTLESWMERDVLITDQKRLAAYTPSIMKEIDEAVLFAEESPAPGQADLLNYVD